MRVKVDYRTASKENYNNFCKEHPNENISYEDWVVVIYRFNELIREHMLETGEKVKFPSGLGDFAVGKKKRKKIVEIDGKQFINLPIDWKKTREKGKRVYNFNHHTEGYSFRWVWFKRSAMFKHSDLWYFKPSRITSRLINHYLTVNNNYQDKYCQWSVK